MSRDFININNKIFERKSTLDFIDIGGSTGGSYNFMKKKFEYTSGLAIDIDPKKVEKALLNNVPMINIDATNMNIFVDNACETISMMHVLEHLPDIESVTKIFRESIRVASKQIFIRGPMFSSKYLNELGFKFFWSSWKGHTLHIEANEMIKIMAELGIVKYQIKYLKPVENSNDDCIHPLNGLMDRHGYDEKIDPYKEKNIKFENLYKEFDLLFTL